MDELIESKRCTKCGQVKPVEAFHRHPRDGRNSQCRECKREYNRNSRPLRKSRNRAPERARRRGLAERTDDQISADRARIHPEGVKRCTKCIQTMPLRHFHRRRSNPDGMSDWCRECMRAYYQANKERSAVGAKARYAANRDERLALAKAWYAEPANRDIHRSRRIVLTTRMKARTDEQVAADQARLRPDGVKRCRRGESRPLDDFYQDRSAADGLTRICREHHNARLWESGRNWWRWEGIDYTVCFYCPEPATSVDHILPVSKGGTDAPMNLVPACMPCNNKKYNSDPIAWIEGHALPDHPGWDNWFSQAGLARLFAEV